MTDNQKQLVLSLLSKDLVVDSAAFQDYARDASFHTPHSPDLVIRPKTTDDVSVIMRIAQKEKIPVTAWGGGSSLEGNPIPVRGGIVLDMRGMNAIVEIQPEHMTATVQPGIIGDELNKQLASYGLSFPAQPGSGNVATIGGMIINNAGGMQAVRYGVVGDWVLQLEVVLADGSVINVGSRSFKSVAGYDLKRLFIGSEGTLGIVTKAVIKLAPLARYKLLYLLSFPSVELAGKAIQSVLISGLGPASLELMDAYNVTLLNEFHHLGWKEDPTVIVEFHEKETLQKETIDVFMRIVTDHQGVVQTEAQTDEERMKIWKERWSVRPALRALYPHLGIYPGDIGLPIGKIPDYLEYVRGLSGKYAVKEVTFGHAGDGNFHTWILYDTRDEGELKKAKEMGESLIRFALSCGGTCTAEHGIGIGKIPYLKEEHPTSIEWMKEIKKLFDPHGILNPGKIFDA